MAAMFGEAVRRGPPLQAEEEIALARAVRRGDRAAFERLCLENIRLVVVIAKDYRGRGVDLPDLIGAGCLGLLTAVERYDPERGVRFAAYARLWIKQAIREEIGNMASTVRVPIHTRRIAHRVARATDPMPILGRLTRKRRQMVRDALLVRQVLSIDRPIVGDTDEDPAAVAQHHDEEDKAASRLHAALGQLSPGSRMVVERTLGLDGKEAVSMAEIGRDLGLTREAIRYRQRNAIQQLRDYYSQMPNQPGHQD